MRLHLVLTLLALGSAAQDITDDGGLAPGETAPGALVQGDSFQTAGVADDIWKKIKNGASCSACQGILGLLKGLASFGDASVVSVVTDLCKLAKIEDSDVCAGSIEREAPVIASALRNMTLGSDKAKLFCSTFFGLCPIPNIPQWKIEFPSGPKPATERPSTSGGKPLKVVQFSDIHVDPHYVAGSNTQCTKPICCRPYTDNDLPGKTKSPAGPNGDHKCDSPVSLELSMYQAIRQIVPDAIFSLFTGDIIDHGVWNTTAAANTQSINDAYGYMSTHLNYVYGTAGNHEANPTNAFQPASVGNATDWLYQVLQAQWGRWVQPAELVKIQAMGAYSTKHPNSNLRIISLNTNLYYRMNFWMYQPSVGKDPNGQIEWLVRELDAAERAGERVYIIGHTPPGEKDAFAAAANYLDQVFNRYSSTIAAMFWGHTHSDHFEVSYSDYRSDYRQRAAKDASLVAYICPSLTPMSGMPAFRVYDVDPVTYAVLDSVTYMADMNNTAFQTTGPVWTKYYSAKEAYGSQLVPPQTDPRAELTPAFWHDVTALFESRPDVFRNYLSRKSRGWRSVAPCEGDCLAAEICQLRAGRSQDNCGKIKPGIHLRKKDAEEDAINEDAGDKDAGDEVGAESVDASGFRHVHEHECGESTGSKTLSSLVLTKSLLDTLEGRYQELKRKA